MSREMIKTSCENLPNYFVGIFSMIISLLMLYQAWGKFAVSIASIYLIAILVTDTLFSKIPNIFNLSLLVVGLSYNAFTFGLAGLWTSMLGFLVGLSLLLIPYLLGGMGGGDVKALAALGALFGPGEVFQIFLYVGISGGGLALLHYLCQKTLWSRIAGFGRAILAYLGTRDIECIRPECGEKLRFPYASAIAVGVFAYVNFGEMLPNLKEWFI